MVRWVIRAASWAVCLAGVAVLAVAVLVPRVAGATPYTILTGSMQPHMPPGTLVVTREVDPADIRIGTVVTYQLRSGEADVVTHRVIGIGVDGTGEQVFRTQGDANSIPDELPVHAAQIRGERWYAVPYVGRLGTLVSQDLRSRLVPLAGLGLLTYAGVRLMREGLRSRRRPRGGTHVAAPR